MTGKNPKRLIIPPDETHMKTGMLARAFMELPLLSEDDLAKRVKMVERISRELTGNSGYMYIGSCSQRYNS